MKKLILFFALVAVAAAQENLPSILLVENKTSFQNVTLDQAIAMSPYFKQESEEVAKALRILLGYSDPDQVVIVDAVFRTRAGELRMAAERAEKREKDIAWARTVLAKWEARAK